MTHGAAAVPRSLKVWDLPVRLLHWTLAITVPAAALTTQVGVAWHQPLGWVAAVAVALRAGWGFVAPRPAGHHARFAQFVRSPRHTLAYAARWRHHREPRHVGHNPLGGWMVLALLASVLGLALSGWLYTTDAWFGDANVEAVHTALAWAILVLVALHVAGVAVAGSRHRENLVQAMLDGRKRPPEADDAA